jgi:hypothetical protein
MFCDGAMTPNLMTAVICVLIAGCGGGANPDEPGAPGWGEVFAPGETLQGIHILGSAPDLLFDGARHFRVQPLANAFIGSKYFGARASVSPAGQGANLIVSSNSGVHRGTDTWLEGMILNGVGGGQIRIEPGSVSEGPSTRYRLSYRPSVNDAWVDYCGAPSAPTDPPLQAVPLRGWYDGARTHHDDDTVTFACDNGVAKKCDMWGYHAGTAGPGDHDWDRHQACTRMANADACGNGDAKTREETPILIRDYDGTPNARPGAAPALITPVPLPGDPDTDYFEAGWAPRGAVCLAKRRWIALPPDPCPPGGLDDPRTERGHAAHAAYCDDMTLADIGRAGALLANGSKMMDAPLHIWGSSASGDVLVSMHGYFAAAPGALPPFEQVAPFADYTTHLGVDSMLLRNLPGSLDAATDMVELHLWQRPMGTGFDRVVGLALVPPAPGFVDAGFEAYSFQRADQFSATRLLPELKLCRNASGFTSTIGTCTGTKVASLGYALPPP